MSQSVTPYRLMNRLMNGLGGAYVLFSVSSDSESVMIVAHPVAANYLEVLTKNYGMLTFPRSHAKEVSKPIAREVWNRLVERGWRPE